jgi:hypothetical protein
MWDIVIWVGVAIPVAILCGAIVTAFREFAARGTDPAPY